MITQYLQAALVAENRVLAHPASVDSIPTSGGQEDHVSMGWGAGKKLSEIIDNVRMVLAVEIMCAVQAIEYRAPLKPAPRTRRITDQVRALVSPLTSDRASSDDIESIAGLIARGDLG
jgi:histidine ammonia-lyase